MSNTNDGGPAFPRDGRQRGSGEVIESQDGMTLRDYFAGQVLAACVNRIANGKDSPEAVAQWAYIQADRMLSARVQDPAEWGQEA